MKRLLLISIALLLALICVSAGLAAGWKRGFTEGLFQASLEENKIAAACLRADGFAMSPEFREYLKGRIYYNIASRYPNQRGYLLRKDWDFGPVNLPRLKERTHAKDPTVEAESFDAATAHLPNAEPNGAVETGR